MYIYICMVTTLPPRPTFDVLLWHYLFCILCCSPCTCTVSIDKFCTFHMRLRFCLNSFFQSVLCIFPNQILVENHRRSSLCLSGQFHVYCCLHCCYLETETCCCTVPKKPILDGPGFLGFVGTAKMQGFCENLAFLLYRHQKA